MEYFCTGILLAFIVGCYSDETDTGPINYAELTLNKKALLGSRWALEHVHSKYKKVVVYHAFEIVDIVKVDLDAMNIRVEFNVHQRWKADTLVLPEGLFKPDDAAGSYVIAEESVLSSVWSPDSFIPNATETKIHAVAAPQSVVAIYPNKTIIYKARMHTLLGCSFSFEWFPLDMQVCDLVFESYQYSEAVVDYKWETSQEPVSVASDIRLYQYEMTLPLKYGTGFHSRWAGQSHYPYVKISFKFERQLGNNLIQVFTPTILIVVLSFFSFWLGLDAVPGRISLLITCILTLVTMHSSLKGILPSVHYIKMMDIWMLGCMTFVFGAMCEFVIVKYMKWRAMQREKALADQEAYLKNAAPQMSFPIHPPPALLPTSKALYPSEYNQIGKQHYSYGSKMLQPVSHSANQKQAWEKQVFGSRSSPPDLHATTNHGLSDDYARLLQMQEMMASFGPRAAPPRPSRPLWVSIDRVCRVMFPLLFCVFNAAYWPILLIESAKQHPDEVSLS